MARSARLLRLVQLLRRYRTPVSAKTLAAQLEVSVRSVYRDVQTLREQGASIEGEAGLGYVLRPGFMLPPLMFSDEELEALVLGLRLAVLHGDDTLGTAATDAVAKLRAVLPKDLRHLFDDVALIAGPTRDRPPQQVDLAVIRRSLRDQRKARIAYVDQHGAASDRTIWPLGLSFFERVRIVIAWCETRADFRSFRADRIVHWTELREGLPRSRTALLRTWRSRENVPTPLGSHD